MRLLSLLTLATVVSLTQAPTAFAQKKTKEQPAESAKEAPPTKLPPLNACGCFSDASGACGCVKKSRCGCPGECEPAGCEEKRQKELQKEADAELKRQQEEDRKRNAELAKKREEMEREESEKRDKNLRGLRLVEESDPPAAPEKTE